MIQNPIRKVLLTFSTQGVRSLLMGGQACVLYGAGEFSRDTDFAILADSANLRRIRCALDELQAETIAVPPFKLQYLEKGHAVHFRCRHPDVDGLRVDVMSKMRGLPDFDELWQRRTTLELDSELWVELLGVPDLVLAKKTQRDKDWPMIRRLLEADYIAFPDPPDDRIRFWLAESRTPRILMDLCKSHLKLARDVVRFRPLLSAALVSDMAGLERGLREEEMVERKKDAEYWLPLRRELEKLRHAAAVNRLHDNGDICP